MGLGARLYTFRAEMQTHDDGQGKQRQQSQNKEVSLSAVHR
jgi:hypothetical protein